MEKKLTVDDARQSLTAHAAEKGAQVHEKYGPDIGWNELQKLLEDRTVVRYPVEIVFDAKSLHEGEFAFPQLKSERPEDGFTIFVHPFFSLQPNRVPFLVLYHLVVVNYGDFASPEDAELFGANALGISKEDYYNTLCEMADEITWSA